MKLSMKSLTLAAGLCATFGFALSTAAQAEVIVTTGAGYIKMVNALTKAYEGEGHQKVAKALGGNIGQMLAQVTQGNGVNVVISDEKALKKFEKNLAAGQVHLGDTPLVMVWRKGLTLSAPSDILKDDIKTVAHPDPKAAIYGRSAATWLKNTGYGEKIAGKIRAANHVPQVYSYVATGDMDVGFVNLSAYRNAPQKVGGHFEIMDHGAKIHMVAQIVKGAEGDKDVQQFMTFLHSKKAQTIMNKFGVTLAK